MFEYAHQYGKFILRAKTGKVYDEYNYCDKIQGSMENARDLAQKWVDKMNGLWNKEAA